MCIRDRFYNEWIDSAKYEDGNLWADDTGSYADGTFYVDFAVTTDRVYEATGDDSEDGQDIVEIDEEYHNHETLGMLTIRKTGEVLAGWAEDDSGVLDPQFSGEAWPGHFVYEERPIPNAEFTITANENVYTQDRQTDASGNRTPVSYTHLTETCPTRPPAVTWEATACLWPQAKRRSVSVHGITNSWWRMPGTWTPGR